METPFIYGAIATGDNFTDREKETKHLVQNFKALTNTIILSPRRWGKSSLVHKAAQIALKEDKKLKICHIDLFNVRNETHFYELFAEKIIASTSSKWEEVIKKASNLMGRIIPQLNLKEPAGGALSFEFKFGKEDFNPDQILDLPEKIAKEKKIKIMVCIDEFQNISELPDGDFIMKTLRSHWQLHQNTAYCLFGSKRHLMLNIFSEPSKPFYRFGDFIYLEKIPREFWIPFFIQRFKETGKTIEEKEANLIAELVDNHPYYCQQLAQIAWLRTHDVCSEEIIVKSHHELAAQLSLAYENITENLNNQQIALLEALINNEKSLTSTEVLKRYGLTSSTSVVRAKDALMKKDILDKTGKHIEFQDPIYRYWLRHYYFQDPR